MMLNTIKKHTSVSYDNREKVFNVRGISGKVRVVTLNPATTCSCSSTGECYHIGIVKEALGMTSNSKKKVLYAGREFEVKT
jgi:hypothetical protein